MGSVADKIGCALPALHEWVKKVQADSGKSAAGLSFNAFKIKMMERENRELGQAFEILRKVTAYSAQAELDRPFKR